MMFMCVYSNHERASNTHVMRFLERHGIPYHYVATTKDNKREDEILDLVKDTDFLVLARYMQVYNTFFFFFKLLAYSVFRSLIKWLGTDCY